jgi:hypothetical protein
MTETLDWLWASLRRHRKLARTILYAYVVMIACPIRYWPLQNGIDETWRFALNYAARESSVASETVFTMGPLGYLMFPQDIGRNLVHGLLFQVVLWLVLAIVFAEIFFRGGFPVRNLALFSFFFALATPLFFFDYVGVENLMLAGALMLIVVFHLRGSWARYLAALALLGLLPMFKLSAAIIGVGAVTGFLVERVIQRRWKALLDVMLTVAVPATVAATLLFWVMPSVQLALNHVRGAAEIIGAYSAAMSIVGSNTEIVSALIAAGVLFVFLALQQASPARLSRFYILLLGIPLFASFKHGFVRQDVHIINFFCFVALALALVALTVNLNRGGVSLAAPLALVFFIIWQNSVGLGVRNLGPLTGAKAALMTWRVIQFRELKQRLDSITEAFPQDSQIELELIKVIGDSPVASLSVQYTNVAAAHLRLKLYPVVQRYAAYTPYLDGLNAAWIRDQGPRFLLFDGRAIDDRDPWAETPAMWLEVYRWYDARLLGPHDLLLERRPSPRFTSLETIDRFHIPFTGELTIPVSSDAIFWTMKCGYSKAGQLQKLFFRVPSVFMSVHDTGGLTRSARVIPEVLVNPVLGNYLPNGLSQFYAVFHDGVDRGFSVDHVAFRSTGSWSYSPTCEVEILRPAR